MTDIEIHDARRPKTRARDVFVEAVDSDLVVYDAVSKHAHCLGPDAASVWASCNGRRSESEIARRLGLAPATVVQAVDEFAAAGLLVDDRSRMSRRDAAKRFATVGGAAMTAPLVYSVAVPPAYAACSPWGCNLSITFNLGNSTPVGLDGYMWFTADFTVPGGAYADGQQIRVTNSSISIPSPVSQTVPTPDSIITFSTGATAAATFNSGANRWDITLPTAGQNGFSFLTGVLWYHPTRVTSIQNVTWTARITTPGTANPPSFNWRWSASDYASTPPAPTMSNIAVLASGSNAGYITNYTRRDGGSDGSWSSTASCNPACPVP